MTCPTCNAVNSATTVYCVRCGTTLIYEAGGHSEEYNAAAKHVDMRMYRGLGAVLGFCVTGFVLKFVLADAYFDDGQIYGGAAGGALGGSLIGRFLAWSMWRDR